jgi:hypothetical protein
MTIIFNTLLICMMFYYVLKIIRAYKNLPISHIIIETLIHCSILTSILIDFL